MAYHRLKVSDVTVLTKGEIVPYLTHKVIKCKYQSTQNMVKYSLLGRNHHISPEYLMSLNAGDPTTSYDIYIFTLNGKAYWWSPFIYKNGLDSILEEVE